VSQKTKAVAAFCLRSVAVTLMFATLAIAIALASMA
jgi:hypothetical protein